MDALAALVGWGVLKGALLLSAAAAAAHALRGARAAVRHAVWAGALAAALLLPLLDAFVPAVELAVLPPVPAARPGPPHAIVAAAPDVLAWTPRVLFALWGIGVIAVGARWIAAARGARRLVRLSAPFDDADWRTDRNRLARSYGLSRPVGLRLSRDLRSPVAWGVRRPVLLLPATAAEWTEERREAVLAHELAHVRRRDCLTGLVAQAACTLHWFNPLAWLAYRRLLVERERACDDGVLRRGLLASRYAAHLIDVAREAAVPSMRLLSAPGFAGRGTRAELALTRRTEIEERIRAMLDGRPRGGPVAAPVVALLGVAALATAAGLGAVEPVPRVAPIDPARALAPSAPDAALPAVLAPAVPVAVATPARAPAVGVRRAAPRPPASAAAPAVSATEVVEVAVAPDPPVLRVATGLGVAGAMRTGWSAPSGPMASDEPRRAIRVVRIVRESGAPSVPLRVRPRVSAGLWAERADDARLALEASLHLPVEVHVVAPVAWAVLGVRTDGARRPAAGQPVGVDIENDSDVYKAGRVDSSTQAAYRPARALVPPGGSCVGSEGDAPSPSSASTIW